MSSNDEFWPGTVEDFRDHTESFEEAVSAASEDGKAIAYAILAGLSGVAQILDKVAYSARKATESGGSKGRSRRAA